jgi:cell division septation protein DedD
MRQPLGEYQDPDPPFGLVGEQRAEEEYPERRRRLPTALLTVAAMAVFAGGLWFAYHQGARNATNPGSSSGAGVPLIRADERPTKVKPDQPGGMDVPDRDKLVFADKPTGPLVEKLLPPAEQPRPVPPAPPQPAPPIGAMLNPVPPGPASATVFAGEDAAPKTAKPGAAPAAKPPAKPTTEQKMAAAPKPATEQKPAVEPKPAATPKPAVAPTPTAQAGGIRVQLGSLRSPEAARDEWTRLKQANSDVLGRLTAVAVRTDLGDKGIYYRIQAGPLVDAAAADHLCGELKKRNLGCALVR